MPAFDYQALDDRGRVKKGMLEGDSARQIRQQLRDQGLAPTKVVLASQAITVEASSGNFLGALFEPTLSVSERALITRQLATLIGAGLPVEEALLAVSKQTQMPKTQKMLVTVRARVMEGYSLAGSLEAYPKAFPDLFRATVAAGESSGHLDAVLNQLADFSEAQYESASRVQQALVYPVILFVLTLLILAGLLGYVVPDIVAVFADTGQALPALTVWIIALSDFVTDFGFFVLLLLVALALMMRRLLAVESNRLVFDRLLLRAPLSAKMAKGRSIAQFASTLSILTGSGVPLVDAMKIAGQVVSNRWLRTEITQATLRVSEGSSLQSALQVSGYFPPMMLYMIASGESSGELDSMLARVARYLQQDVEALLATLLSLIGPLMLIIMGGAVFTIVMAILLPIINLNQMVG
ncbi:MAG: type II secretion system inner membrane protein GspF [Pseudomonadales bacterium]|jgi:general secretion pathway protein F|nr:type II secretion system inner membrane protein GspF [Pseudomonadales bacterium]MDA0760875.1 type II secretion system inner membrane protein GspF [Pseudomonadota bacterium]MDA0957394.1 type II secretion system inner membrane protein GspF [Pseudomonadota bacterium]